MVSAYQAETLNSPSFSLALSLSLSPYHSMLVCNLTCAHAQRCAYKHSRLRNNPTRLQRRCCDLLPTLLSRLLLALLLCRGGAAPQHENIRPQTSTLPNKDLTRTFHLAVFQRLHFTSLPPPPHSPEDWIIAISTFNLPRCSARSTKQPALALLLTMLASKEKKHDPHAYYIPPRLLLHLQNILHHALALKGISEPSALHPHRGDLKCPNWQPNRCEPVAGGSAPWAA